MTIVMLKQLMESKLYRIIFVLLPIEKPPKNNK